MLEGRVPLRVRPEVPRKRRVPELGVLSVDELASKPESSCKARKHVKRIASIAAAHFTTLAAAYLAEHGKADTEALKAHFRAQADYRGPERRGAVSGDD